MISYNIVYHIILIPLTNLLTTPIRITTPRFGGVFLLIFFSILRFDHEFINLVKRLRK